MGSSSRAGHYKAILPSGFVFPHAPACPFASTLRRAARTSPRGHAAACTLLSALLASRTVGQNKPPSWVNCPATGKGLRQGLFQGHCVIPVTLFAVCLAPPPQRPGLFPRLVPQSGPTAQAQHLGLVPGLASVSFPRLGLSCITSPSLTSLLRGQLAATRAQGQLCSGGSSPYNLCLPKLMIHQMALRRPQETRASPSWSKEVE